MNAEINKKFIFNYLAGKATALQKQLVDDWVRDPTHEELFYQWLVEYEYQQPQYLADVNEAIGAFQEFAERADEYPASAPELGGVALVRSRKWLWLAAASLALALVAAGGTFQDDILYRTHRSAYGETQRLVLSDSTRVVLNANSALRVPRFGFGPKTREVVLSGEANFDVTHRTANQKFVVKTGKGFEVVVLGTEFTVYARSKKSKVILNRGKVQLRYREGQAQKQILMKPGDLVTLDQDNHVEKRVLVQPDQYAAWKDHRFVFDDTTLAELAEIMQEGYGIELKISDKNLAKRTLVGSFRAESPEELLETVAKIFNLKMSRSGNVVTVTGE